MVLRLRRSRGEAAPAGAPDRRCRPRWSPSASSNLFVVQIFNGGGRPGRRPAAVRLLLPAADPVRGRGAALPALRHRGDHQPDRRPGVGSAFAGDRLHDARRRGRAAGRTGGPAGSGCPCWRPHWSRSPSSRCGGRSSGWPTGWPTGRGPSPTRRCRTSAAASPRRRPRTRCCLPSRRPPAGRSPPARDRDAGGARCGDPQRGLGRRRGARAPTRTSYRSSTAAPAWAASRCTCPGGRPVSARTNGC